MNLSQLTEAISGVIQDSSFDAVIGTLINEAVLKIAAGDMIPGKYELTPPLPDLYTVDTVDTELLTGICDLPDDFNRDVVQILNSSYEEIPIEPSVRKFLHKNKEQNAGAVYKCAVQGKRLLYRDIPAVAETLTVHYYKTPDLLAAGTDEPTWIPTHLHRKLIVGYVCKEIFDLIEDGIEDPKTNTKHYENIYQKGLMELEMAIGTDKDADYYETQTDYCP